jgi:hypothetical protein
MVPPPGIFCWSSLPVEKSPINPTYRPETDIALVGGRFLRILTILKNPLANGIVFFGLGLERQRRALVTRESFDLNTNFTISGQELLSSEGAPFNTGKARPQINWSFREDLRR